MPPGERVGSWLTSSQPPNEEGRWRAPDVDAHLHYRSHGLTVGTVKTIRHGFLRGVASQKGNLTRYTRYLARQLAVGDYH